MKKLLNIILIVAVTLIIVLVGMKTFSGEDTWICSDGEWIKHGNPSTPKPTTQCDKFCVSDNECETPMKFLFQSNCPFGSACINNKCRVVCPIYESACTTNTNCNCDQRGDRTLNCICHRGTCVSIEG